MNRENIESNKYEYVHIVVGDSAYGCLKEYFKKNRENRYLGKIINLKEDFSIGSIFMLDENIDTRYKWFKKMYMSQGKIKHEVLVDLKDDIFSTYKKKLNLSDEVKVVIWHGKNTSEQVALSYLVNRYKNNKVYEVDITKCFNDEEKHRDYEIRAVAECDLDELNIAINTLALIEDDRAAELINRWENITNNQDTLRILKGNEIVSVDESYYDDLILDSTTEEYIKAARVVGQVMGVSEQLIGDSFLLYRISTLINNRLLDYQGDLWHLGTLYIKKNINNNA